MKLSTRKNKLDFINLGNHMDLTKINAFKKS